MRSDDVHSDIAKLFGLQLRMLAASLARLKVSRDLKVLDLSGILPDDVIGWKVQVGCEDFGEGLVTDEERREFEELWQQVDQAMTKVKDVLLPRMPPSDLANCPLLRKFY